MEILGCQKEFKQKHNMFKYQDDNDQQDIETPEEERSLLSIITLGVLE